MDRMTNAEWVFFMALEHKIGDLKLEVYDARHNRNKTATVAALRKLEEAVHDGLEELEWLHES